MSERRVLVVGAGLAGLVAARRLAAAGHAVTVVDKGRGVGGRLATRRIGAARLDHGAQFFTVRAPEFAALADGWLERGVAREWTRGFAGTPDGHPRYVGAGGMTDLAKDLAAPLPDVRTGLRLGALGRDGDGRWSATVDDGTVLADTPGGTAALLADAVVLTPPVPQSLDLLAAGAVTLAPGAGDDLARIRYTPTLALLSVPGGPAGVPAPGGVQLGDDPTWSWVGDNQAKGISAVPAVTLHVRPDRSGEWWDRPRPALLDELTEAARRWTGTGPDGGAAQLVAWRYAAPSVLHDRRCLVAVDGDRPLVCAGDAFGEARVEGAARSGQAAADAVATALG